MKPTWAPEIFGQNFDSTVEFMNNSNNIYCGEALCDVRHKQSISARFENISKRNSMHGGLAKVKKKPSHYRHVK